MANLKYSEVSNGELPTEDEDVLVHLLNSAGIRLTRRYANCDYIVAETEGAAAGALAWYYIPDRGDGLAEVGFSLAVDPSLRRQGIAKQLITLLLDRAKRLHVDVVTADVLSQHLPALLVSLGFKPKDDDSLGTYELDMTGSVMSARVRAPTHVCVVAHNGAGRRFVLQSELNGYEPQVAAAALAQAELRASVPVSSLRRLQTMHSGDAVVALFVAPEPATQAANAPNPGQPIDAVPDNEFDRTALMLAQNYLDRAQVIDAASEYRKLAMVCWLVPDEVAAQFPQLRNYPDLPHCTLACFDLPEDEEQRSALIGRAELALRQLAASASALSENCKTTGVARFAGEEEDPVVVSLSCPGINDMRSALVGFLTANGVEIKSNFEFTPHITIGYLRKEDELGVSAEQLDQLANLPLRIESLALVAGDDLIASSPLLPDGKALSADFGRKGRRRIGQETTGPAVLETWEASGGGYQFCLWEGALPKLDSEAARDGKWIDEPPFDDLEKRSAAGEDINLLACSIAALSFLRESEAVSDLVDFDDDVFVYVQARELFIDLQLKQA